MRGVVFSARRGFCHLFGVPRAEKGQRFQQIRRVGKRPTTMFCETVKATFPVFQICNREQVGRKRHTYYVRGSSYILLCSSSVGKSRKTVGLSRQRHC